MRSLVILCVAWCIICVTNGINRYERATNVASQLRQLLDDEKGLRQKLESRIQSLKMEADGLNRTIVPCKCPSVASLASTKPSKTSVAFTGTLPTTMTGLTPATTFNFTGDLVNIGKPIHWQSGHFVAPVSGLYGFSLAIYMNPAYWTGFRLVMNGQPIVNVKTGHYRYSTTNRQVNMATNYALVNVTAGDEIWPQYVTGSGARLWADGVTTFTGILLHEF